MYTVLPYSYRRIVAIFLRRKIVHAGEVYIVGIITLNIACKVRLCKSVNTRRGFFGVVELLLVLLGGVCPSFSRLQGAVK